MRKTLYYILFIVLAGVSITYFWTYDKYVKKDIQKFISFNVEKGLINEIIKVRGELTSEKKYNLEPTISGTVEKVFVKKGDIVKKGDLLLKLDTKDFELELKSLKTLLTQGEINYEKLKKGAITEDINVHAAAVDSAKTSLKNMETSGEEEVKYALNSVELAQVEIDNLLVSQKNADIVIANAKTNLKNIELINKTNLEGLYSQLRNNLQKNLINISSILTKMDYNLGLNSKYDKGILRAGNFDVQIGINVQDAHKLILNEYKDILKLSKSIQDKSSYGDIDKFKQRIQKLTSMTFDMLDNIKLLTENVIIDQVYTQKDMNEFKSFIDSLRAGINTDVSSIDQIVQQINILKVKSETDLLDLGSVIDNANIKKDEVDAVYKKALIALKGAKQNLKIVETKVNNQILSASGLLKIEEDRLTLVRVGTREEDLSIAQSQIEEVQTKIDILNEKINKSNLYSPFEAKIISLGIEQGEYFKSGFGLSSPISLVNLGYNIQSDISEVDIAKIKENQTKDIEIRFDAFPSVKYSGAIISIEPQEVKKDGDNYYRVNISLNQSGSTLRSGMNADLNIIISTKTNILKIPELTIFKKNGKSYTYLVENGSLKEVEIKLGISDGENVEVVSGVKRGDKVAILSN